MKVVIERFSRSGSAAIKVKFLFIFKTQAGSREIRQKSSDRFYLGVERTFQ